MLHRLKARIRVQVSAAHTVEVDDIYSPGLYHPGVALIPAALAVAEDPRQVVEILRYVLTSALP